MRSLTVILYLFIMGCLLLATTVADYMGADYYEKEVEEDYLIYAQLITNLVTPQILHTNTPEEVISAIKQDLKSSELKDLKIITLEKSTYSDSAFVSNINITDQTDHVTVVVLLPQDQFEHKALEFHFQDSFSDGYMDYYLRSSLGVFLFMGLVISVLAFFIYRYMNQLSEVSRQVANGHCQFKMPNSPIGAVQKLSDDINSMASALDEKATENAILTGAIHHELRIPITRIRLILDIALKQCGSAESSKELHGLLQDMDMDIEEFIQLTEELLTISRLSLIEDKVPTSQLSALKLLKNVSEGLSGDQIKLVQLDDFNLDANQTLMERALANILGNALKYAKHDVHISIIKKHLFNCIRIEDDGPGIPEEERELILKPFYRIDKSRNRHTGGFGLGLAIANMVIKHSDGQLLISNSPLGGACIELSWSKP